MTDRTAREWLARALEDARVAGSPRY